MSNKLQGYSVSLPLIYDKQDGPYRLNKTLKDVVRQNLKNLILTDPGERIMVPNFGAGIRRLLFEPMNSVVRGKVTSRIISQVSEYMGFVQISDIIVLTSENDPDLGPNTVRLVVKYNLGNVNDSDTLIITQNQY
tara:strand:+ start:1488 stop:1892 length:405 start_codon:yes stop_codon:yes gene_type:complete